MSPSIAGVLQRKNYFIIIDKDEQHPRKPYFDLVCFEITKDDPFYHQLRYINKPSIFYLKVPLILTINSEIHCLVKKKWMKTIFVQIVAKTMTARRYMSIWEKPEGLRSDGRFFGFFYFLYCFSL